MIRIVCVESDFNNAAHVGGPVNVSHRTFDVDAPEVEKWLAHKNGWAARSIVGVEVITQGGDRG